MAAASPAAPSATTMAPAGALTGPVVGSNGYPYLQWDYHFMVQTESGEWAEKRGSSSATILHTSGNPSILQWDAATYPNFYTSDILYFAITN